MRVHHLALLITTASVLSNFRISSIVFGFQFIQRCFLHFRQIYPLPDFVSVPPYVRHTEQTTAFLAFVSADIFRRRIRFSSRFASALASLSACIKYTPNSLSMSYFLRQIFCIHPMRYLNAFRQSWIHESMPFSGFCKTAVHYRSSIP